MLARHIAVVVGCLLLLVGSAHAQTNLGALRLGYGQAEAGGSVSANDDILWAADGGQDSDDTSAAVGIGASVNGTGQASQGVIAQASIGGSSFSTVYVPQATLGVSDQCMSDANSAAGFLNAAGGDAQAFDAFLIDDANAQNPVLTGFMDIIVTIGATGTGFAVAQSRIDVGRAQIISNGVNGYNINWDDQLQYTIEVPDGASINMIIEVIDPDYPNPVSLNVAGNTTGTGSGWGAGQASSEISLLGWFEVQDFGTGNGPTQPQISLQARHPDGSPDGNPIPITPQNDPMG